jgi:formate-dependent nitrite reductase membrane component NrfD
VNAKPGALGGLHPDSSARGVGDGVALPAHASPTYYDRPMLKKPHWEWEVVTYLFMGGIMGGSGMLVFVADHERDTSLERNARYIAFVLAATCPLVLIKHLGRPERFHHMLRIFKLKSVMSMGVWGLIGFALPATAAALGQAATDGLVPDRVRWLHRLAPRAVLDPLTALLGAFIAGYTGVLISATAIPIWAIGKRHIPAISVCSGMAGACALNAAILAFMPRPQQRSIDKLERLELVAGLAELALLLAFERHAGALGAPMFAGTAGRKLRGFTMLGGIAVPALLNLSPVHGRAQTLLAAVLTLLGGYVLRERLIEGGKASADDPRAATRQPE